MKPLSKPQESIYYTAKFFKNSGVHNIAGDAFWKIPVTVKAVMEAIIFILKGFDIFHTRIVEVNGVPMQYIQKDDTDFEVPVLKFNSRQEYLTWVEQEQKRPIDIFGKLYKLAIVEVDGKIGAYCAIHHIIADATSFVLINNYLTRYLSGERDILMYQYDEYLETEETYKTSKRYEKDKKYWLKEYNNYEVNLYSPSAITDNRVARKQLTLDKELMSKIKSFCEENDITEYVFFLAILGIYYHRISGKDSFFIGTPVLNRFNSHEENMLGTFVNLVPIGFSFDNNPTYLDICTDINDKILSAFRHQRYSYMELLKEISELGNKKSDKLFDFVYNFLNVRTLDNADSSWFYTTDTQSESVLVQVDQHNGNSGYNLSYNYHAEKFNERHIEEMHHYISSLIESALTNADQRISETRIDPLCKDLLNSFNNTSVKYSKDKCIYQLFEQKALEFPDKPAVIFKDINLSYKELNSLVDSLSKKLMHLGIKKNDVVAIHLERSHKLVAFQLAVLKSGAIFFPLDKRFPEERIKSACDNCNVKLLITDESLTIQNKTTIIDVNDFEKIESNVKSETVFNNDSCYIIYTSGSTGIPKGCLLTGKGLLNFCKNNNTLESLNKQDSCIFACVNTASFDYFIAETLLPLTNGFTTVILDDQESTVQKYFSEIVIKHNINVVMTTPTRLKIYFDDKGNTKALEQFRCICTSGEPLSAELLTAMYEKAPHAKVYNPIGPSECSVWDMGGELNREDGIDIHIGKPIANAQIYITDKYMNLLPIGVTGEICIGGDGVGAGYLNNPELTAERFIDNPFGEGKLYRTGDLAYWREDGNIVFVGRNDFQVKIRGLRIELGEIENAIQNMDGVVQCAVVVRKDEDNTQFICAFYTGTEINPKDFRESLNKKLPKYMIPHIFTHLAEMPMTTSGKTNRNALPEIDLTSFSSETEFIAAETEEEIALEETVRSVLKINNVNMIDNFFNIGGDSIKAIYIVSELEDKGYALHVADIMQKDTLSDVAKAMKPTSDKAIYSQDEVKGIIPFSPIMHAFLKEKNEIPRDFVHTCIISANCDEATAKKAFDVLVSHHDMLRGTFCDNGIEIHLSHEREAYSFETITSDDTDKAKEHLNNISINNDKLVNVVFCNTEKENLIRITVHHFLIDLVSWEVLIKDFQTIVKQLQNNEVISLPAKTASFMLWSEELQKYSEAISEEIKEYWENVNNKLDNTKSLYSQDENDEEEFIFTFDKDTTAKLSDTVNTKYGTRTNEVLLTALGLAASKLADGAVGIMVESHGRTELHNPIAIERTVGWFTSCYPVVINNTNNVTDELINTKETLRRISKNGIDYLLLSLEIHKNTNIIFNYYKAVSEEDSREITFSGSSAFPGKINVNCFVVNDVLTLNVSVPKCKHRQKISEDLGSEFVKQIEKIINICTASDTVIKTCSDFSDDKLTAVELDELKDLFDLQDVKDIYSLTSSQEGIYAQYFQSTDTKTYQLQNLCQIGKETNLDALKKSVELLSLRHPVLKTAFTVLKSSGEIKQIVLESRIPEFRIFSQDEPFSQKALDRIISEKIKKSLDLQKDSLFRVTIVDFTDKRFMFMHTHHIILDGWCLPVIINDLQKYYGKLSDGISTEELSAEIQKEVSAQTSYAQYVNWIKNQDKHEISKYWHNLLADSSISHIFGKEKKDNVKNEDAVTVRHPLNNELSQHIEQFARENRVSLNTVFECAFSIALQKYSGSDEVVFNKIISGRSIPLKNIENTVGPFINTVPVRIKSDENTTVAELMNETKNQTINADKYGVLSLAGIYKACGIESKSIDALFVFENYYIGDSSDVEDGPLKPKLISFDEQTEFNLTVTILKENNDYTIRTSYAKEMYTESEISAFINGYISILGSALDESKEIKDICVTDKAVIDNFNNTSHTYAIPEGSTLYSLFESTAKANSEKLCITTAERSVTFGELLKLSENLDSDIRSITKGKKSVIAIIAERSVEMYSAVYGIIRGGNAYLPIDPDYPQERIEYILRNSEAAAVLTQGKFNHLACGVPHIDMSKFIASPVTDSDVTPSVATEDDCAYVIYTSGSTGNPKGAKVSHKSAVNRILWMHDKYHLGTDDVILQKTPYTFDVSVWEFFWWAMVGGSLAASKPGEHFLPAKILDEIQNNKITHLHFVPSVFELFLNYLETHSEEISKFMSVKYVFVSGEALTSSLVQRFYMMFDYSKVTLHNLYGPTECAVDVTYYDCTPDDLDPVPIGKPIYNTQMYVVDKYMKLCPIGVVGELCIAGMNVGQGYLNNPVLTSEKFIDNPFGEGKLYKTGDLAYLRDDGNIIFCGRLDGQIKLNGQRIEIGEIELTISNIHGVESAAVLVRKIASKEILVAFYSGKDGIESKIKEVISDKLPKYMVPSVVIHLDNLPLNQSGKLDRKFLAQRTIDIAQAQENEKPLNDTEKFICDVFADVLGESNIGRNSDFFENGGTSLTTISILSEKGFEDISAAEFIRNSTPAKLALLMKNKVKSNLKYLKELYVPSRAKKSLILLPFAGGGAEAFSKLITDIKEIDKETAIYFVPYLHSLDECQKAAKEISTVIIDTDIYIYSHCVGSAIAIQLIKNLEENNIVLKHFFAGASIPPAKPANWNIWNIIPDFLLKRILTSAGADFSSHSPAQLKDTLKNFRLDTDFSSTAYANINKPLRVPVSVIINKNDAFTKNYADAQKLWKNYFYSVDGPYFIDSQSHYFQVECSKNVAEIILSK